jgi:hypothetical protein
MIAQTKKRLISSLVSSITLIRHSPFPSLAYIFFVLNWLLVFVSSSASRVRPFWLHASPFFIAFAICMRVLNLYYKHKIKIKVANNKLKLKLKY